MRHAINYAAIPSIFFAFTSGLAFPDVPFSPFVTPLIQHFLGLDNNNDTSAAPELRKRQEIEIGDACPEDYNQCIGLGAAGLCCSDDAQCALDNAGRVACCPNGAFCTGIIEGLAPTDDIQSITSFELASTADNGVVINVGGTSTQGFVIATEEVSAGERPMVSILFVHRFV